ncbi:Ycf66 family protein [Phormidium sp. CLA17]|uniref:Ycf66 family protein n=1 Tax=Leptolyngbya sp. Cla-17 TaxID=2803751 RepID=UPI001492334C|nr:Ycf66 family protein [Leptolyngbya sp. Cla-17]MBM0743237.1 Ycf66 family protein [Leptolyngbya sp. Cla-17]
MLAYILAFLIGSGSFALYMAAFFFPEVHRKNDFAWSGIGLFYALVLWVCAERITGGVLLGQTASVALIGWLGWQTFLLRRQVAPLDQQTPLPTADEVKASLTGLASSGGRAEVTGQASRLFNQLKQSVQGRVAGVTSRKRSPTQSEVYVPPSLEEFGTAGQDAIARFAKAAIPEDATVQPALSSGEDRIRETIPVEIAEAEQTSVESRVDETESLIKEAANTVMEAAETADKAIAPVGEQAPKMVADTAKGLGGLFQGFNQNNQKKESKPVYVRKQFREETTTIAKTGAPAKTGKKPLPKENQRKESKPASKAVYVRKQFREETASELKEPIEDAIAEVKDSTSSLAEIPTASVPTSTNSSEAVVPNLLGNAPVEISAEEIVEDLLEDISVQEGTLTLEATEIIEVAIELGDATIDPITWVAELENDTAPESFLPKHITASPVDSPNQA